MTRKLLLVDGHSLIHRAYHAYPKNLATAKGELTNAVYGFTNILLTAINDLAPAHAAVAFDLPRPTFREQMFVGYKQSRPKPEDELVAQIPRIKEIVTALNIPIYEVPGFEADDVIGTLAKQGTRNKEQGTSGVRIIILTSDRDLMQLIRDENVVVQLPAKGKFPAKIWDETDFTAAWGFSPQLLPDYKALAGDASDDIPGVQGIGEKTAKRLVAAFGSLNDIYRAITQSSKVKSQNQNSNLKTFSSSMIKKLAAGQEDAQLSKKLATIDTDVPIKIDWKQTEIHEYDKQKVLKLFDELQFRSLTKKLPNDSFEQIVQEVLF